MSLDKEKETVGGRLGLFLAVLFIIGVSVVGGMLYFGITNPTSFSNLGTWGDFFGGTLNPLLTFLTFLGVLTTIAYQKIELNLTRKELDRSATALEQQLDTLQDQIFENTFFRLLELHNTIVNSIDLRRGGSEVSHGRDCFNTFYARLKTNYRTIKGRTPTDKDDVILNAAYGLFWSRYQSDLGHYFRFLFNIIRFIQTNSQGEVFYIKLLRSQLSDQELLLLFYNCLSPQGIKFKSYAEEFALFDNMPIAMLLNPTHVYRFEKSAYGSNPQTPSPWPT